MKLSLKMKLSLRLKMKLSLKSQVWFLWILVSCRAMSYWIVTVPAIEKDFEDSCTQNFGLKNITTDTARFEYGLRTECRPQN